MIIKTGTTQTRNQIQVLMLKSRLIQTPLSEKKVVNTRKLTTPTFPEDQILFQIIMELLLLEKPLTDGKETQTTLDQQSFQHLSLLLKRRLIQTLLSEKKVVNMKRLTTPTSPEDQISFQTITVPLLLEKPQIDGKETQIILDQPSFQHLNLLPKRKLIQMIQLDLCLKRLINNTMEFSNLKSHLTSQMPKILMISRTGIIQTNNQILVLILKRRARPKLLKLRPRKLLKLQLLLKPLMLRKMKRKLLKIKIRNLNLQKYQLLKRNPMMVKLIYKPKQMMKKTNNSQISY